MLSPGPATMIEATTDRGRPGTTKTTKAKGRMSASNVRRKATSPDNALKPETPTKSKGPIEPKLASNAKKRATSPKNVQDQTTTIKMSKDPIDPERASNATNKVI